MVLAVAGTTVPASAAGAGDVISAQSVSLYYDPTKLVKVPAKVWKILYRSTSARGTAVQVSGTVLVPNGSYSGTRPIVGYAMGTHGLGDQCAPSALMQQGKDQEIALISLLLAKGWAVAVTDYEGLGTPGLHTYMAGISQGQAVLDSIRAATRVPGSGLSASAKVGVIGYSQGGASAGWAAQLQPSYAPELQLRGVAAGGVPADLQRVAANLDGTSNFGLSAAAGIGLNAAYPELSLDAYLTAEGRTLFTDVSDDCGGAINSKLSGRRLSQLTTTDVMNLPAWQARLAETRLGSRTPGVPVYLYHGDNDEVIPLAVGQTLRRDWCNRGAKVLWTPLPAPNHVAGAVEGAPLAITWLHTRFNNLPVLSNC
ncbi:lipase family protein [Spongiactinospora sp. TRM90649]|uniref:lipase family protein n=1 Tax=Spongiactinospora sp. TRM90649 TaxID=3031114 RepID=UPI0023F99940|nr:lipase family protein [Spongiactinospora sp. TRM90649]MDF5751874.1 lipase family protein [Spongiactinospora sp. TRM90649]